MLGAPAPILPQPILEKFSRSANRSENCCNTSPKISSFILHSYFLMRRFLVLRLQDRISASNALTVQNLLVTFPQQQIFFSAQLTEAPTPTHGVRREENFSHQRRRKTPGKTFEL